MSEMSNPTVDPPRPASAGRNAGVAVRVRDLFSLTKPGITAFIVLSAAVGFHVAPGAFEPVAFLNTLLGIALASAGASAYNHLVERDVDARMLRTRNRPLPTRRLAPGAAAAVGAVLSAAGIAHLFVFVNTTASLLAAGSAVSYVLVYTPLKRRTTLATLVGGVPGALPIVAGWAGAGGPLDAAAAALFWILFLWQIPHFLALAWLFREDYRAGGLRMLSVDDEAGYATAAQSTLYAAALLVVGIMPTLQGVAGTVYFFGALALSGGYLALSLRLLLRPCDARARHLFLASLAYLPLLLGLLVIDHRGG